MPHPEPLNVESIVERLRRVSEFGGTHLDGLWTEAADEIDRLRAVLVEVREGWQLLKGLCASAHPPIYSAIVGQAANEIARIDSALQEKEGRT